MGLWDRVKRIFRPAPVVTTPEPPPPDPFERMRPRMIYANPPLPEHLRDPEPVRRPSPPRPAEPAARNLEIEAAIAADPTAVEPYLVRQAMYGTGFERFKHSGGLG